MATQTMATTNQQPPGWVEPMARFGYAIKGIVYLLVGFLAAQAAFGVGGQTTGTQGALQHLVTQPFGRVLLSIVGGGLICYALWRLVQALFDPEYKGHDFEGLAKRGGYAVSGIIYGGLAYTAFRIVMGSGGGNSNSTQDWTARLLAQPFGPWLVGGVGVIVLGVGAFQLYRGLSAGFYDRLEVREMSNKEETLMISLGRFGLAARGIVLGLISFFLLQAAYQSNAQQAKGLGKTLQELAQQPFGPWLLGIAAIGLIAYALFMMLMSRYRTINV